MTLVVREMRLEEVGLIIGYFHDSTPEHLEVMGVDPTRLPIVGIGRRCTSLTMRNLPRNTRPFWWSGSSTADGFGIFNFRQDHLRRTGPHSPAYHLDLSLRASGIGSRCLRETVQIYFHSLKVKQLLRTKHIQFGPKSNPAKNWLPVREKL